MGTKFYLSLYRRVKATTKFCRRENRKTILGKQGSLWLGCVRQHNGEQDSRFQRQGIWQNRSAEMPVRHLWLGLPQGWVQIVNNID